MDKHVDGLRHPISFSIQIPCPGGTRPMIGYQPNAARNDGGMMAQHAVGGAFLDLDHVRYMRRALELAWSAPPALYRALIVDRRSGAILAEGANDASTDHPLVHGETDAINRCFRTHPGIDWTALALYSTAEPCAMCQSAAGWAGISLVVYGTAVPTLRRLGFDAQDIRAAEVARRTPFSRCEVIGGVLEAECDELFAAWQPGTVQWPPPGHLRSRG
jgi:tRNA(Arg) A34 adenosine deaminase TadA